MNFGHVSFGSIRYTVILAFSHAFNALLHFWMPGLRLLSIIYIICMYVCMYGNVM